MTAAQPAPPVSGPVRVTTVGAVLIVALVAALVSYAHMQEVAARAGEGWRAGLMPLSVDGLVVAASMVLLTRRRAGLGGGWLAWSALLGGVGASLAANMAAAEPTLLARLVAAWPALAFAVAFELLLQQRRADPTTPAQHHPGADPGQAASTPTRPGPALVGRPDLTQPAPGGPRAGTAPRVTAPLPVSGADPVDPLVPLVPLTPRSPAPVAVPSAAAARRSVPGQERGQPPGTERTDAQLAAQVRGMAAANGGTPPSRHQLRQALGIGDGRAARLLAALHTTPAPVPVPAHTGPAHPEEPR